MKTEPHADKAIIDALGGPAELARALGFDTTKSGVQRVHNWTVRGIPDSIRLRHLELFGRPQLPEADAPSEAA